MLDFENIPEKIALKAKIVWINYPNSPTGVNAPLSWMKKLLKWANKYNIIVAADEGCYNDIYFNEKPNSILEIQKEGVIVFYSLSKRNNMTGYRVGFVAGDEKIISIFRRIKTNVDSGTPNFIQEAASLALNDNKFVCSMRKEYLEKKNALLPVLLEAGFEKPLSTSTFYLWLRSSYNISSINIFEKFLKLGIVVTPGSLISDDVPNSLNPGKFFIRIALVPTFSRIKEAIHRIKNNLNLFKE